MVGGCTLIYLPGLVLVSGRVLRETVHNGKHSGKVLELSTTLHTHTHTHTQRRECRCGLVRLLS